MNAVSNAAAARLRIVLVGTQHPGNIGSAARAMKTMGLARLVLVAPEKAPDRDTQAMAAGADDLVAAAPVFPTLAEAVADCRLVLGCTARSRRVQLEELAPRAAAARAVAMAAAGEEVALVFGRERTGLDNNELQLCHAAVHIPSDPAFSSLNLAAAVQVLAYELRIAVLDAGPVSAPAPDLASHAEPARRWRSGGNRGRGRRHPCCGRGGCVARDRRCRYDGARHGGGKRPRRGQRIGSLFGGCGREERGASYRVRPRQCRADRSERRRFAAPQRGGEDPGELRSRPQWPR